MTDARRQGRDVKTDGEIAQDKVQAAKQAQLDEPRHAVWWTVTLFIMSVVYLVLEVIFNMELVTIAGGLDSSKEALHSVEIFGRTMSGIGSSLLVADWLVNSKGIAKRKVILNTLGVFVFVWPIVFFGQKAVIDAYLINPSSIESRQAGYLSFFLKSSLVAGTIEADGLSFKDDQELTPKEMTFLTALGLLLYADPNSSKLIDEQKELAVRRYVAKQAASRIDEFYTHDYKEMTQEIELSYSDYKEGVTRYNDALNVDHHKESIKIVNDIEDALEERWIGYQKSIKRFDRKVENGVPTITSGMADYFKRVGKCRSVQCANKYDKHYRQRLSKAGVPYIHQSYWLISSPTQKSPDGTYPDWLDEEYRYADTGSEDHYRSKLKVHMIKKQFNAKGVPYGIPSFVDFEQNKEVRKEAIKKLRDKGLWVEDNWRFGRNEPIAKELKSKAIEEANDEWVSTTKLKGFAGLKPGLSWKQFQLSDSAQSQIKEALEDNYVPNVLVTWNRAQFKSHLIDSNVERISLETLAKMVADKEKFSDGQEYEQSAKDALRAILVPPISMALSLILVVLTITKLLFSGIPLALKAIHKEAYDHRSTQLIKAAIVILVIVLPMTVFKDKSETGTMTNHYLQMVEDNVSGHVSFVMSWVLGAQPVIYPVGSQFEKTVGFYGGFDQFVRDVEAAREKNKDISEGNATSLAVKEKTVPGNLTALTVKSNVASPRICIMNIKPKFKQGIKLREGSYAIELSKPGYETRVKLVDVPLVRNGFDVKINLTPL